jgi:hypothetical protein
MLKDVSEFESLFYESVHELTQTMCYRRECKQESCESYGDCVVSAMKVNSASMNWIYGLRRIYDPGEIPQEEAEKYRVAMSIGLNALSPIEKQSGHISNTMNLIGIRKKQVSVRSNEYQ